MDLSLIFTIIALTLPIIAAIYIKRPKIPDDFRFNEEAYKLRIHLITNRIDKKECICTPECLQQTKLLRLQALLPPPPFIPPRMLTRERFGSTAPAAAWARIERVRPFQFFTESSAGTAP